MRYTSILFDLDGTLPATVCRSARDSRCAPRSATGRGG